MSIRGVSGLTFTKNQQIFQELCILHPERFLYRLMEIRKILGLPKINDIKIAVQVIGDNPTQKEWNKFEEVMANCEANRQRFLGSLNEKARSDFFELIEHILTDNKLGKEWTYSLIDVAINGFFVPPVYNLRIETDSRKKTFRLVLNPDTSLEDVKIAWGFIQTEKERILGKMAKRNVSKKSAKNLIDFVKAKNIQKRHPELKGTGLIAELFPIPDDEELSGDSDRKAANNLRQIKSRLSHKV